MASEAEYSGNTDQLDGPAKASKESSFHKLQKRSFGGEDVAARPGAEDDEWWPKGPLLPGIEEVTKDFLTSLDAAEDLHVVFLLGGAGNGKSYTARALGKQLNLPTSASDALAHRIYATTKHEVLIELLNDATIAPSEEYRSLQSVALASDIDRWWEKSKTQPVAAFCCVNRGIVIDELRALSDSQLHISGFARKVIAWLASPEMDLLSQLRTSRKEPRLHLPPNLYAELRFDLDDRAVRLSAISADASSLMHKNGSQSRAAALFEQIVERCGNEAKLRPMACPIRANMEQLLSLNSIQNWEKMLAHSEIASGRLHSYRDIWGLAALSILGPRFANVDGTHSLLDHVDRLLHAALNATTPKERLAALLDLSHFRMHNSLFRAPIPFGENGQALYPSATPSHLGLSLIDPSTWGSTYSNSVECAMQSVALGDIPSKVLKQQGMLADAWFEFDERLERAIVEHVGSSECSDALRRRLISWLCGYLTRLVGVSTGHLGNQPVIEQWESCRIRSTRGVGRLPLELEKALRSLIFPQHDDAPSGSILVPAFAARVEPLVASRGGATPKLAEIIPHDMIHLRLRQQGSRIMLECTITGHGEAIGQLLLDFPLLREALACTGTRAGRTEATAHVEPRVERCRASSLSRVSAAQVGLVVVSGGSIMELI